MVVYWFWAKVRKELCPLASTLSFVAAQLSQSVIVDLCIESPD